jgi:hypothetical protein
MNWRALRRHYSSGFGGFEDYSSDYLKIEPKSGGQIIPLSFNRAQQLVLSKMEEQQDRLGFIRLIILKARRLGMSTLATAYLYWMSTMFAHTRCTVVSHLDSTNDQLWKFVDMYRSSTPKPMRLPYSKDASKALWHERSRSGIACLTAGSSKAGRGGTNQGLLLSEAAWYPASHDWRASILSTVSRVPGTFVAIESTAFGMGNDFEVMYHAAEHGDLEYIPIFLPWFWDTQNVATPEQGMRLTVAERALAKEHDLTPGQLMWRRITMAELSRDPSKGNPEDAFHQEHPSNAQEAFLYTGRNRFERHRLVEAAKRCRKHIARYEVELGDKPRLMPADNGRLKIWEVPNPDHLYVVGADPAKGLSHGDNSAAYVVNLTTGKDAASWVGKIDPHPFGDVLVFLAKYYGKRVEIICESNGIGWTTITRMQQLLYPFIWQREGRAGPDGRKEKHYGFETMPNTKPTLIAALDTILRDHPEHLMDEELIKEMYWFLLVDNKNRPHLPPRMEAAQGKHDDRVIARALASLLVIKRMGKAILTPQQKVLNDQAEIKRKEFEFGRRLYRGLAKQKSSTPGWTPSKKKSTDVKGMIATLTQIEDSGVLQKVDKPATEPGFDFSKPTPRGHFVKRGLG